MKPIALSRLNSLLESPGNSAVYGKNGLVYPKVRNERGFKASLSNLPYSHYMGCIETDEDPIIFSTNGINSAIGIYRVDLDQYVPILNDIDLPYKLGFSKEGFIQGVSRRNYLGEREIVWIGSHNKPSFFNLERAIPEQAHLLDLFITAAQPRVSFDLVEGGNLKRGAYYVGVQLISEDESETGYYTLQGPIYTYISNYGGKADAITSFSLRIDIEGMDTNFSRFKLAVVSNIAGIVTAKETDEFPMTGDGRFTYVYSNNNLGTDITLEEVLIPSGYYENAKAITQENDILYLGNTKETELPNLQQYFMGATVRWVSELVSIDDPDLKSGKKKTLKHGEVYALYGVVRWKNGRASEAYHIPGPSGSTEITTKALFGGKSAQYRKAVNNYTWQKTAEGEGTMTGWTNIYEKYPNTEQFGNLAGKQVQHHRLPMTTWCKGNLYQNEEGYGINKLDILGVKVTDLNFPPELQAEIESIEIYHAKRNYGATLVYSQGVMMMSSISTSVLYSQQNEVRNALQKMKDIFREGYQLNNNGVKISSGIPYFTGTNLMFDTGRPDPDAYWTIPFSYFHLFHSPESIIDKFIPSGFPFIQTQGWIETKFSPKIDTGNDMRNPKAKIMDGTSTALSKYSPFNRFAVGERSFYLINDQEAYNIDNAKSEGKLVLQTITDGDSIQAPWEDNYRDKPLPEVETITLVDLMNANASDLYPNFYAQELVKMGRLDSQGKTFGGDTFICEFGFNTMGIYGTDDREIKIDDDGNPILNSNNQFYRKVLLESSKNLWIRYIDESNPYDKFYDGNITSTGDDPKRQFPSNVEINTVSLPVGSSAISSLLNGILPFNPWDRKVYKNPFKIIRSQKQARENKYNSWRKFPALDYFETIKDKGEIINLVGQDGNLLIHHEHAIYKTVSKTTLNGDILSVTLGTGDIFQMEPQEGRSSKTGIAGLQHPLHCAITDAGYIFVDIEKRVIYCANDKGLQPLNGELDTLFKEVLKGVRGNPYNSENGISIGYDDEEMRVLFTMLNGNNSLTFSLDIRSMKWVYSHDYLPNAYITTRNKLLNIKNSKLFRFNEGAYGKYHTDEIHSYYVDVAFVNGEAFILNSVNWRAVVERSNNITEYMEELWDKTFTSITIWNGNQCSGKIDLNNNLDLPSVHNARSPEYRWHFNKFRNLVNSPGSFLRSIFQNFEVIEEKIQSNVPWYNKGLFNSDYIIVRFEYDNKENNQITVVDLNVDISKSYR